MAADMVALSDVRKALAAQLAANVKGLRTSGTVPGQINPPMAIVRPARGGLVVYQETFDGAATYSLEIVLLVAMGNDRTGQTNLDQYIAPTGSLSVYQAVAADPTLGHLVADCDLHEAVGYGLVEYANVEYIGTTFDVEVMAT